MIFKLQVGLPKSPNLGQVLNFHTQSVHFLLTLQLRQLAKTTTTLQTFFCAFFRSETFLLSVSIAFVANACHGGQA